MPIGNIGLWVTPDDLPKSTLRKSRVVQIKVRLTVGVDGRASGCHVTQATLDIDDTLQKVSCAAILRRARFKLPRSETGAPAIGWYFTSVRVDVP